MQIGGKEVGVISLWGRRRSGNKVHSAGQANLGMGQ